MWKKAAMAYLKYCWHSLTEGNDEKLVMVAGICTEI